MCSLWARRVLFLIKRRFVFMIIIDNLPTQIQVPKHSSETENLSFSLFGVTGEVFTTDNVSVEGLHYAVLIDGEIPCGTYRYQVQKDNRIVEMGLLKYKTSQTNEVYESDSKSVVYYE